MKINKQSTDQALLTELGERLSRERLAKNLTQARLAADAGVSKRTVERLESGESVQVTNFFRVLRALGLLEGVDALVPESGISPIAQLERKGKRRRRASTAPSEGTPAGPWNWGE